MNPDVELDAAGRLLELDRPGEALEVAGRLLAGEPGSVRAMLLVARSLGDLGRNDEALAVAERAAAADPADLDCRAVLAGALAKAGRADEAMAQAEQLRILAPDDGWADRTYASVAMQVGRTDAAIRALERALGREPDDAAALAALGFAEASAGRAGAGLEHLRAAMAIEPDVPEFRLLLGTVAAMEGSEDRVIDLAGLAGTGDDDAGMLLELSASGLLRRPAAILTATAAAVLAAGLLVGWLLGLVGLDAPAAGGTWPVVALQIPLIGMGALALGGELRRIDERLEGGGMKLLRNRMHNGPAVMLSVVFAALAVIVLVGGVVVGFLFGAPAGSIVLAGSVIAAVTSWNLARMLGSAMRSIAAGRRPSILRYLLPCAPGAVVALLALPALFVLGVLYVILQTLVPALPELLPERE